MAAASTLEMLEARYADLEQKILGGHLYACDFERLISRKNPSVTDVLVNSTSLTCTALSGREKIHTIVPRMGELDGYLDPTFEDNLDMSALIEVLISLEPSFYRQCQQLEKLTKLSPVLDSKEINNVLSQKERQEQLLLTNLEKQNLSEQCCARVYKLVEEYNMIVTNITKTLVHWDITLTQIELESKPKKVVE